MQIDFKKLGADLTEAGLVGKSVDQYSKAEIEKLIRSCINALIPPKQGPFKPPYIDDKDELIIPFDSDPKYHWWRPCGQSMAVTMREIKAPDVAWQKFLDASQDLPF